MSHKFLLTYAWWCAVTIFLSAFLLFQVQPVISKMILPWFGGGPAVWTTCMLFFQVLLLGGYAYAHYLAGWSGSSRWPRRLHMGLLAAALITLPITPGAGWKPPDGSQPTGRILLLLLANIGLPYFLLASTGPLVQAWYARVLPERSPYRLYALSNVASLGALLTYPFVVEPWLNTATQSRIWSILFAVFAFLCGILTWVTSRAASAEGPSEPARGVGPGSPPPVEHRLAWLLLPALASSMLLAITNHVCQDVAVVPFLWVVPLSLYLLSFIVCFDSPRWYRRHLFGLAAMLAIAALCVVLAEGALETMLMRLCGWIAEPAGWFHPAWAKWLAGLRIDLGLQDYFEYIVVEAAAYLIVLLLICMICHGELVRLKPHPRHLTAFYLMIASGGALGGILVALIAPQVFSSYLELGIGLVAAFMLAMTILWDDFWQTRLLDRFWKKASAFVMGFLVLLVVVRAQFESLHADALLSVRNFYGVLTVNEYYRQDDDNHIRELLNGRILHGSQFVDAAQRRIPTTYYNPDSGIGVALRHHRRGDPIRVGVVGLGTGTLAAYGSRGDYYCFYEINPHVSKLASEQFTYLRDSPADVQIVEGDARIRMERQGPQRYDVIALDAFSSDAIPAHLLTREAFQEYLRHLEPDGIIAVHISNRHLDLSPVVAGQADHFDLPLFQVDHFDGDHIGEAGSTWALLTRNKEFYTDPLVQQHLQPVEHYEPMTLWTDQYSSLVQILDW